jgi:hypothetical protein
MGKMGIYWSADVGATDQLVQNYQTKKREHGTRGLNFHVCERSIFFMSRSTKYVTISTNGMNSFTYITIL